MEKSSRSESGGPQRVRLFVALDLPAPHRGAIGAWRDAALASRDDLRPVPVEALHVTLAFLGSRPEEEVEAIARAAFAAAGGMEAPWLEPGGLRGLPPRAPRLFALDLEDAAGRCARLQRAVGQALVAEGVYAPEKRAFWPHVTLARVRRGRRPAPLEPPPPPCSAFQAHELTLYRSRLSPAGARYEPLARLRLP